MSLQDILREAQTLSSEERRDLIKMLVDTLASKEDRAMEPSPQKHSLRELRGLGKEIWEGVDAQDYINQQRDEWDQRP
jgi:hypothetical protein